MMAIDWESGEREKTEEKDRKGERSSYAFIVMLKSLNIIFQVREMMVFQQKDCSMNIDFWFLFVCMFMCYGILAKWKRG